MDREKQKGHDDIGLLSHGINKLLLHTCCAPCSCSVIERLILSKIEFSIIFYNPNIHPVDEYNLRKEEIKTFAKKKGISFFDADYDSDKWFDQMVGLEKEPERGLRCMRCFDIRLERVADFANMNGFDSIATSLGISRWKDLNMVNSSGERAASRYDNIAYFGINWRKQGGVERMIEITKNENFYRQQYCGCVYSLNQRLNK